jgi:hypothetical protein
MEGRGVLERAENSARVPRQVTCQEKIESIDSHIRTSLY